MGEEELLRELDEEALQWADQEAFEEMQNVADCALYEQHMLGGVPCPLCELGRLQMRQGELVCTSCEAMRAPVMDESLPLEDVSELLGIAEERHRQAGCSCRSRFVVSH